MTEEGWYTDPYRVHEHRGSLREPDGPGPGPRCDLDRPPSRYSFFEEEPRLVEPPASPGEDHQRRRDETGEGSVDPVDAVWTYFTRGSGGL